MSKKPRTKTHYHHIKYFDKQFKQLLKSGIEFELVKTTYSRKISTPYIKYYFNANANVNNTVLNLINVVRRESMNWLKNGGVIRKTPIDYFNLLNTPSDEIICKIDIRSAYWKYALLNNIISQSTDEKLTKCFEEQSVEEYKKARTKILGSLATRKSYQLYKDGKRFGEEIIETQPTRDIYIEICRGVDDLMKLCSSQIPGCVYYYFDCMFISKEFANDAIEFFRKKKYDVSVEETRLEFFRIGDIGYLLSTTDDKMYMTRRENKHLIEQLT